MHLRLPQNVHKDIDLPILALYPLVPFFVSLTLPVSPILSVLLFFGLPCLYLSLRLPHRVARSALFSFVLGIPLMIIVSYIANATGQWEVPTSILPRLFGFVPVEELAWTFLNIYYIIMFYVLFFEGKKLPLHKRLSRRFVHFTWLLVLLFAAFLALRYIAPQALQIPYFYAAFGIVLVLIPVCVELFRRPKLAGKFFLTQAYFFWVAILYEIPAIRSNWWSFDSDQYIGRVTIGGAAFAFEELFFWIILFALACLSYYEFLFDDER